MKKRIIPLVIPVGILLILMGLSLMVVVQVQMRTGMQKSQAVISKMTESLPERTSGVIGAYPNSVMPVLEIDGSDYVAILDIPSCGIVLPVANQWDSDKLVYSPARFTGSAYDGSLVIGGADYPEQFEFCGSIEHGDLITITDMTGTQFSYSVSCIDRAKKAEKQWLQNEEYDLTLFCRSTYSMEYIVVRCVSVYN